MIGMRQTGLITPFSEERVKCGAYELALGEEASVTSERKKVALKPRGQLRLPPGQFGLLLTQEVIRVPNNAIGFISIRFKYKCRGLVNVSGFHVDPGFKGHLKFAVYNAGSHPITLSRGDSVFMIWFSDLSEATEHVYKNHADQDEITSEDQDRIQGKLASPPELKKQIDRLKIQVRFLAALVLGTLLALLSVLAKSLLRHSLGRFVSVGSNH